MDWEVLSPLVSSTPGEAGLGGTGGSGVLHDIALREQILQFGTLEQGCPRFKIYVIFLIFADIGALVFN